jgi:hypothetical protein
MGAGQPPELIFPNLAYQIALLTELMEEDF